MILAPAGHVPGSFPNEIGYAYGPSGPNGYLCPMDPQFNTRGEAGHYFDTPLGAVQLLGKPSLMQRMRAKLAARRVMKGAGLGSIPTDAELAYVYGWTPVNSGWIASNQGYVTGPWVPPNGWRPSGPGFGPPTSLNGLRDGAIVATSPNDLVNAQPDAAALLAALNAHNERIFTLTMVSTLVGGLAAMLAIVRTVKGLRND